MPKTASLVAYYKQLNGFDSIIKKVKFLKADQGNCLASFVVEKDHTNPLATLHGGFASTLIDCVSGLGLTTHPTDGEKLSTSVNLNISFIKAAKVGEEIIIDSKMIQKGKRLAFMDVEIRNKTTNDLLVKAEHIKYIF